MKHRFIIALSLVLMLVMSACTPQAAVAPTSPAAQPTAAATSTLPAPTATVAVASATTAPTAVPATATFAPATATAASSSSGGITLNVAAASSLTAAFGDIGKAFQTKNPGVTVTFNFAGSQGLAQQINNAAPADVFASANQAQMDVVVKGGRIDASASKPFVNNRLVVIYPTANPAGIKTLNDLAKPGIKLVLADKTVPVGQYALNFLDNAVKDSTYGQAYKDAVLKNVVSYEQDVKSVLTKVELGEADAGIVYTTDAATDKGGKTAQIAIPDSLNVIAVYPIAVVKDSPNLTMAQAFVDYVLSTDGQAILTKYGFIPVTK